MDEKISEVDLAYQILSKSGKDNPIYFKDLIREIITRQKRIVQNEAATISEIYTMINMDSRFQHVKDGLWGLSDWYPPEKRGAKHSEKTSEKSAEKKSSSRFKSMSDEDGHLDSQENAEKEARKLLNI